MPFAAYLLFAGAILALAMTIALTLSAATPPPVTSERQGLTINDSRIA